jgi:hypothetical protein
MEVMSFKYQNVRSSLMIYTKCNTTLMLVRKRPKLLSVKMELH